MAEQNSRLEPFLLLARSTKGAAAAKVVMDATAANGVYTFSELMDLPNIKDLDKDPAFQKQSALLKLFAHGTVKDLAAAPDNYPSLSSAQQTKLKHLSLVSLALQHRSLPYAQIAEALQVDSTSEVENLIIDVIYADLMGGKMHHHERVLHVDWVTSRDLTKTDLVDVKARLDNWCQNADTMLSALDQQIAAVRAQNVNEAQESAAYQAKQDKFFAAVKADLDNSEKKQLFNRMGGQKQMLMGGGMEGPDSPMFDGGRVSSQRSQDSIDELPNTRAKKRAKD